jgi:hypothetical protein
MMFLLRILPLGAGVLNGFLFFLQTQKPGLFPWICFPAFFVYLCSVVLINRHHWKGADHIRALIPAGVVILFSGYGLLLVEGNFSTWVIPLFVGLVTYAILELQFLHAYVPARYPANSLSHLNLFLVPCAYWMAAYTSVGLMVFINITRLIAPVIMGSLGLVMFYATSHAEAPSNIRWRWAWIGMWVGVQLGILQAILPLTLHVHAAISAICGGYVLRTRRYGIQPPVPTKTIIVESVAVLCLLVAIVITARWL